MKTGLFSCLITCFKTLAAIPMMAANWWSVFLQPGKKVRIEWYDSKPGVTDDNLEHLFDRLYRVDSSRNRKEGGSGLGLAICRNIVEAHEGSIRADHSELGGLKLIIELPCLEG